MKAIGSVIGVIKTLFSNYVRFPRQTLTRGFHHPLEYPEMANRNQLKILKKKDSQRKTEKGNLLSSPSDTGDTLQKQVSTENGQQKTEQGNLLASPSDPEMVHSFSSSVKVVEDPLTSGDVLQTQASAEDSQRTTVKGNLLASPSDTVCQPLHIGKTQTVSEELEYQAPDAKHSIKVLQQLKTEIGSQHMEHYKGEPCIENPSKVSCLKEVTEIITAVQKRNPSGLKIKLCEWYLKLLESLSQKPPDIKDLVQNRIKTPVTAIEYLKPGMEVSFPRPGFEHHAVATEVNPSRDIFGVVHLTGPSTGTLSSSSGHSLVSIVKEQFKFDSSLGLFTHTYPNAFSPAVAAERANILYDIGRQLGKRYNLLDYNCQHFSCYCVTGQFCSSQVGTFLPRRQINYALRPHFNKVLFEFILQNIKELLKDGY